MYFLENVKLYLKKQSLISYGTQFSSIYSSFLVHTRGVHQTRVKKSKVPRTVRKYRGEGKQREKIRVSTVARESIIEHLWIVGISTRIIINILCALHETVARLERRDYITSLTQI